MPKISITVFLGLYIYYISILVHGDGDCKFQTSPGHWAALGWTRHLRSSYRFALWRHFPWQKTQKPPSMQSDRPLALAPWASIGEYTSTYPPVIDFHWEIEMGKWSVIYIRVTSPGWSLPPTSQSQLGSSPEEGMKGRNHSWNHYNIWYMIFPHVCRSCPKNLG